MAFQTKQTQTMPPLALVLLATFTITLGYGVILPAMPFYLQHLVEHSGAFSVSWHTGVMTGVYSFALFVFAPVWGRLSDRIGRYPVLLFGLSGFSASMLWFALAPNLANAYLSRVIAGFCAAAVLPTSLAAVVSPRTMVARARAVAAVNAANAFGFLTGPALASVWTWYPSSFPPILGWLPTGFNVFPMLTVVLVGLATTLMVSIWWRDAPSSLSTVEHSAAADTTPPLTIMLLLTLFIMFALGSFEVSYAILAQQQWLLTSRQVAGIFVACSMVMIFVQLFLFAPLLQRCGPIGLTIPSLLAAAAGIALLPEAKQYLWQMSLVSLIALGTGLAIPTLAYSVSLAAGHQPGRAFGHQIAVTSLGQALGAGIAGVLFNRHAALTLWLAASLLAVGAVYYLLLQSFIRAGRMTEKCNVRNQTE
ncbi:MAG: MFS transporter [Pseudomonadota bacterium]